MLIKTNNFSFSKTELDMPIIPANNFNTISSLDIFALSIFSFTLLAPTLALTSTNNLLK